MREVVACPECGAFNEAATETIENLQHELSIKLAQVKRLAGERAKAIKQDPRFDDAMSVLEYWRDVLAPATRELNGQRLSNCLARLHGGYTVEHLRLTVDGYATLPYVVDRQRRAQGRPTQRKVDAEMIFRDATYVDRGLAMLADKEPLSVARLPEHLRRLAQRSLL